MINCKFIPLEATAPLPPTRGSRPVTAVESSRCRLGESLKKSFFYRKWLNKSIEGGLGAEEFGRCK